MEMTEVKCKPFYIKFNINSYNDSNEKKIQVTWHHKTKSRPNQDNYHKLYKFEKYYLCSITPEDKRNFLAWYTNGDQLCNKYLYNFLTGTEDYGENVACVDIDDDDNDSNYVRYDTDWQTRKIKNIEICSKMYVIKLEDGKLITDYKPSELRKIEKERQQEADFTVINTMLRPSLDNILDKYGMCLKTYGIEFKNRNAYTNFVKTCLSKVINELNENGYEVRLNPRIQSMTYTSTIVNRKDIKLKTEKKE